MSKETMDILEFALQMERDGERFYRQLASRTAAPGMKSTLNLLAEDEIKHARVLNGMRSESSPPPWAATTILAQTKNVFQQMNDRDETLVIDADEALLFRQARDLEQKSIDFYLAQATAAAGAAAASRELFLKLAEEEKRHYFLVEHLLVFISRPKLWLENAEFNHLDEY